MSEAVSKFANEEILPKVRDMDEKEMMDPSVIEQCFEQGLMGVEIPEKYGGAGMNFTSAIVGMVLFCQFWYWYPLAHCACLAFDPTAIIGLDGSLQVSLSMPRRYERD